MDSSLHNNKCNQITNNNQQQLLLGNQTKLASILPKQPGPILADQGADGAGEKSRVDMTRIAWLRDVNIGNRDETRCLVAETPSDRQLFLLMGDVTRFLILTRPHLAKEVATRATAR